MTNFTFEATNKGVNPLEDTVSGDKLISSIRNLTDSIHPAWQA